MRSSRAGSPRRGRRSRIDEGYAARDNMLNVHKPLEELRDHQDQVMLSEMLGSGSCLVFIMPQLLNVFVASS